MDSASKPEIVNPASALHRRQMERLAAFVGADRIEYTDHGTKEHYVLKKGDEVLCLRACGNKLDGGFLVVDLE